MCLGLPVPQVYLGALQEAYQRAVALEGDEQAGALQLFGELAQRIGHAHAGFVAGAGASLAHIMAGGIDYALQASPHRPSAMEAPRILLRPDMFVGSSSSALTVASGGADSSWVAGVCVLMEIHSFPTSSCVHGQWC